MLTFDLHSLATLAAARALEMGGGAPRGGAQQRCQIRERLNLRRKCSWAPRHEPVRFRLIAVFGVRGLNLGFLTLVRVCKLHTVNIEGWATSPNFLGGLAT